MLGSSILKVALVGNGSVGKTSFIHRLLENGFTQLYKQTIGLDFFQKTLYYPREQCLALEIWDIGGQNINSKMTAKYLHDTKLIFLCYDVTNLESFYDLEDWLALIKASGVYSATCIYLIGNKIDLLSQRVVTEESHANFIQQNKVHGGFYISARNGDNVVRTLYSVAAIVANLQVTEEELSGYDKVVCASVMLSSEKDEPRTAIADQIEAQDSNAERSKKRQIRCNPMLCVIL